MIDAGKPTSDSAAQTSSDENESLASQGVGRRTTIPYSRLASIAGVCIFIWLAMLCGFEELTAGGMQFALTYGSLFVAGCGLLAWLSRRSGLVRAAMVVAALLIGGVASGLALSGWRSQIMETLARVNVFAESADDVDFPGYLGPQRTGVIRGPSLSRDWEFAPTREIWRQPVGEGYSSFAVVGESAVTMEQQEDHEAVVCYDVGTGNPKWSYTYPAHFSDKQGGPGPRTTPTILDDRVYTLGAEGDLVCLDFASGMKVWHVNILSGDNIPNAMWGMCGSPLVLGELVIVNPGSPSGDGLAAYRRSDGKLAWRGVSFTGSDKNLAGYSSPMLAKLLGEDQVLIFSGIGLSAHDPTTGRQLWRYPWKQSMGVNVAQPVVVGDEQVFITSGYDRPACAMLKIEREDEDWSARLLWHTRAMASRFSTPVLHEKHLYGLDKGILVCVDAETGVRKWKKGRFGNGQILLTDDLIIVLSDAGEIALVKASEVKYEIYGRQQVLPRSRT